MPSQAVLTPAPAQVSKQLLQHCGETTLSVAVFTADENAPTTSLPSVSALPRKM